jgi:site-specific DNA-methyltransferase (adenine-specific)
MGNNGQYQLYLGDTVEVLPILAQNSVNFIFCDLPYGTTQNKWDIIIPFDKLWYGLKHVAHKNCVFAFTATFPFAAYLALSNIADYKYDMVWEKTIASGQLNVRHRPLRTHENILIFAQGKPVYNEQLIAGKPYTIKRSAKYANETYGSQSQTHKINDGYRHATSVLRISNPRIVGGHPTEKPVELVATLVKMYSNPNDLVLDPTMGSASTGIAALSLNRRFVGIEKDVTYFHTAEQKLKDYTKDITNDNR